MVFRDFARHFAANAKGWPRSDFAALAAAAIDRAAADGEAEGNVYDRPPPLEPPFDEDFGAMLVDEIRRRRPHAPPDFKVE
jgi:hypothetical protein